MCRPERCPCTLVRSFPTFSSEFQKEQNRVKDATIRKLERKLDDKTAEMEDCVAELKKMHRAAQQELREKLEELKRKFTK